MCYCAEDFTPTTNLYDTMRTASGRMGIRVDEPAWCEIAGRNPKEYIDGLGYTVDPKEMMIVVVVIKRKEDKKAIKAFLDNKLGIPS
jgi:hypothetical protein